MMRIELFKDLDTHTNQSGYPDWLYLTLYTIAKSVHNTSDGFKIYDLDIDLTDMAYQACTKISSMYENTFEYFIVVPINSYTVTIVTHNMINHTIDIYGVWKNKDDDMQSRLLMEPMPDTTLILIADHQNNTKPEEDLIS